MTAKLLHITVLLYSVQGRHFVPAIHVNEIAGSSRMPGKVCVLEPTIEHTAVVHTDPLFGIGSSLLWVVDSSLKCPSRIKTVLTSGSTVRSRHEVVDSRTYVRV